MGATDDRPFIVANAINRRPIEKGDAGVQSMKQQPFDRAGIGARAIAMAEVHAAMAKPTPMADPAKRRSSPSNPGGVSPLLLEGGA